MKETALGKYLVSGCVIAAFLAGCMEPPPLDALSPMPRSEGITAIARDGTGKRANLYVLSSTFFKPHSSVKVFAPGNNRPFRTITAGISNPVAMAFDGAGNLYVANSAVLYGQKWGKATITVYAPGESTPARTITEDVHSPGRMAFDSAGNLYAIMQGADREPDSVAVYAAGTSKVLRVVTAGLTAPIALALDRSDQLFVSNYFGHTISVYGPGKTSVRRRIELPHPNVLTFGRSGDLYAATEQGVYGPGSIRVYLPGASSPQRSISTTHGYVAGPLVWDGSGHLFASESAPRDAYYGVIDEYAKSGKLLRTIPQDALVPGPEAFDASGDLYVADCPKCAGTRGRDAVRVYGPKSNTPLRTIYVITPFAIAFGP